jgi:hypothetical protein
VGKFERGLAFAADGALSQLLHRDIIERPAGFTTYENRIACHGISIIIARREPGKEGTPGRAKVQKKRPP